MVKLQRNDERLLWQSGGHWGLKYGTNKGKLRNCSAHLFYGLFNITLVPHQDVVETNQQRAQEDKMPSLLRHKNLDITGEKQQRDCNEVERSRGSLRKKISSLAELLCKHSRRRLPT